MNPEPAPYGCSWCGTERQRHGRRWTPIIGVHQWQQPSQDKIKERMLRRRADRLAAEPTRYHATTAWEADAFGEDGIPHCADCKTDTCRPWMRIQDRLDRIRWQLPTPKRRSFGGWDADVPF
ncbi:hypothetical protein [Streptomyces sp. DSM 41534]